MEKALIIGASGQVGTALTNVLKARGIKVTGTYRTNPSDSEQIKLDITNVQDIRDKLESDYDVIYIAASTTNVEECEKNPDSGYQINVEGINNILNNIDYGRFVYFSTDYVFDGKSGPYFPSALVNPIQKYGMQKYIAENLVLKEDEALVIRTNMVYGPDPQKRNYSSRLRAALEQGKDWNAFNDEYVTPTFNIDLAEKVVELVQHNVSGLVHIAGHETTTRYDFSLRFAKKYKFNPELIKSISVNDVQRAPRPIKGGLKCWSTMSTRSCFEVFDGESLQVF